MIFDKLKEIRTYNDLKQKEVADLLKVERATYSNWENGYGIIPLPKLLTFCNYFHVSLDFVCGLTKENNYNKKYLVNKEKIGLNLKNIRTQHKDTQQYIASKIKISQTQYSDYELGHYLITTPVLIAFCKFYNISMNTICN